VTDGTIATVKVSVRFHPVSVLSNAVVPSWCRLNIWIFGCESASNLDPTPIVHQIVEAEAELFISGVFDRRPTVTRSFFLENRLNCNAL
jgi:hypothetical protein